MITGDSLGSTFSIAISSGQSRAALPLAVTDQERRTNPRPFHRPAPVRPAWNASPGCVSLVALATLIAKRSLSQLNLKRARDRQSPSGPGPAS